MGPPSCPTAIFTKGKTFNLLENKTFLYWGQILKQKKKKKEKKNLLL